MAWISFGALPCRKKLDDSSRLDVVEITRVPDMLPKLVSFLVGLRTYQHPGTLLHHVTYMRIYKTEASKFWYFVDRGSQYMYLNIKINEASKCIRITLTVYFPHCCIWYAIFVQLKGVLLSQNTTILCYLYLSWRHVSAFALGHLQVTRYMTEETIQCES